MRTLLCEAGTKVDFALYEPEAVLSSRQIKAHLPSRDFRMLTADGLKSAAASGEYAAIVTSRVFEPLATLLKLPSFRAMTRRAQIVAFLGGLDFFPQRGLNNRKECDAVYLFPKNVVQRFEAKLRTTQDELSPRQVGFGHPAFLMPEVPALGPQGLYGKGRDIYFFAQAISPSTKRGRRHILDMMIAIARAYPDRKVLIKLRHLPEENTRHLHRERFSYPDLLQGHRGPIPENLHVTACTMAEAIRSAAVGITCTSTAAVDLVREGVPTMVYLDYVDFYADPLAQPMAELFYDSGLIKSLDDILHLRHSPPKPTWMSNMFCSRELARDVIETVDRLRQVQSSG